MERLKISDATRIPAQHFSSQQKAIIDSIAIVARELSHFLEKMCGSPDRRNEFVRILRTACKCRFETPKFFLLHYSRHRLNQARAAMGLLGWFNPNKKSGLECLLCALFEDMARATGHKMYGRNGFRKRSDSEP